jgi:hypothetical protein
MPSFNHPFKNLTFFKMAGYLFLFALKRYYIWELVHHHQVLVRYEDVRAMVQEKEATLHGYVNAILATSTLLLVIAALRRASLGDDSPRS